VVDHIACELVQANSDGELAKNNYLVTVVLLLQVDDGIGTTPTAAYTEALKAPDTSLVTSLGLDVNATRKRTFTTTYNIDMRTLAAAPPAPCAAASETEKLRYNLKGDLKLGEIVKNGFAAKNQGGRSISAPTEAKSDDAPSFGSEVEFIVTRAVTTFGPVWTLRYWTLPSGSGGLLNGKNVYKNSVTVTFVPQYENPPSQALQRAIGERDKAVERRNLARRRLSTLQQSLAALPQTKSGRETRSMVEQFNLPTAQAAVEATDAEVARAEAALRDAEARDSAAGSDARQAAVARSQALQTTILLQNIRR
jgi:hypothetical protein